MATIDSLQTLLVEQLRDLYDAEKRMTKAIPKMAKKSTNADLRSALKDHLAQTEEHSSRLEEAFEQLDEPARGKPCAGMRGILEEGDEHVGEDFDDDGLRDATIIGAAQRVEHYEIAAYGTAIAHARLLGRSEIVSLLEQTLEEEKAADKKLTDIAEGVVNLDAAEQTSDERTRSGNGDSRRRAGSGKAAGNRRASSMGRSSDRPSRRG